MAGAVIAADEHRAGIQGSASCKCSEQIGRPWCELERLPRSVFEFTPERLYAALDAAALQRQPPPEPAGWFRLVAKTRHAVADNGDAVAKTRHAVADNGDAVAKSGDAVAALGSHLPDLTAWDRTMVTRLPKVVTRLRTMVTRSPNMVTRYPQLVRKSPNPLDLPATTPGPYPKWVTTSETRGSTRPGGSMTPALAGRCVFRNRKCTL